MTIWKKKLMASAAASGSNSFLGEITIPDIYQPQTARDPLYPISTSIAVASDGAINLVSSLASGKGFVSDRRATIVNLAPNGEAFRWGAKLWKAQTNYNEVYKLATCFDRAGNVYSVFTDYPGGIFITKHSPTGQFLLRREALVSGVTYVDNFVIDPYGNIYIIGRQDSTNALFMKLDSAFNVIWKTNWGYSSWDLQVVINRGAFSPDYTKFIVGATMSTSAYVFTVNLINGSVTYMTISGAGNPTRSLMDKDGFIYTIKNEAEDSLYKGCTLHRMDPRTPEMTNDWALNFQYTIGADIALDPDDNVVMRYSMQGTGSSGKCFFTKISKSKEILGTFSLNRASSSVDDFCVDRHGAIYVCGRQIEGWKGFVAKIERFGALCVFGSYTTTTIAAPSAAIALISRKSFYTGNPGTLPAVQIIDRGDKTQVMVAAMTAGYEKLQEGKT